MLRFLEFGSLMDSRPEDVTEKGVQQAVTQIDVHVQLYSTTQIDVQHRFTSDTSRIVHVLLKEAVLPCNIGELT